MARIKRYRAHKPVAGYSKAVQMEPGVAALVPAAAGQFGKVLSTVGEPFLQARRVDELSQHTLRATKEFAELDAWAQEQPDFKTIEPEYKKQVAKLSAAHRKEIKDPAVWRPFYNDFQRLSIRGGIKAQGIAREKETMHHRANAGVMLDEYSDIVINSVDFETGALAINQARVYIAGLVAAGTYDELEGQKLEQDFTRKAHINFIKRDILNDPEEALKGLESGEYKGLDEADRTDLIIKADTQVSDNARERLRISDRDEKDLEEIREDLIDDNEFEAWQQYYGKTLTLNTLELMADNREINEKTYRTLREKLDPDKADEDIEDDPIVVGEIAEQIELGMDVRPQLKAAIEADQISGRTYIQMSKLVSQKEYKEGSSYISDAMKPSPADKWSPDKNLKYAEAFNRFNDLVSEGIQPLVAAKEVVTSYTSDLRRTINGLRKPAYLEGRKDDSGNLEKAEQLTVAAYRKGQLTDEQYNDEIELIYQLKDIVGTVDNVSEETKKRFEEGRK